MASSYMAGARFFVITTKHYTHTHCQHCTPPTNAPIPTQAGLPAILDPFLYPNFVLFLWLIAADGSNSLKKAFALFPYF